MSTKKHTIQKLEKQRECKVSLLDLPDEVLDCILKRLSPQDLFRVGQVCTNLRNNSSSDHLWENHVKKKWSGLVGDDAHSEWQYHTTKIINEESHLLQQSMSGSYGTTSGDPSSLRLHSYLKTNRALTNLIKNYSQMALYICLETGHFCFPAQVYKVTLSYCYDALVSYDSKTNTFHARSPNVGRRIIERDIQRDRLRIPPPKTFLVDYYESNGLADLSPGDHVEIQKRRRRSSPYCDWGYAEICHLKSCDKDVDHCSCQDSDTLLMWFSNDNLGFTYLMSRSMENSQGYPEFNFFKGIRKLNGDEIEKWNNLILARWDI